MPRQKIWSWHTSRWWVGCHIWYSKEGTGHGCSPPSTLLAVPNVTAHQLTASVPITVLPCNGLLHCGFNLVIKGLRLCRTRELFLDSAFYRVYHVTEPANRCHSISFYRVYHVTEPANRCHNISFYWVYHVNEPANRCHNISFYQVYHVTEPANRYQHLIPVSDVTSWRHLCCTSSYLLVVLRYRLGTYSHAAFWAFTYFQLK